MVVTLSIFKASLISVADLGNNIFSLMASTEIQTLYLVQIYSDKGMIRLQHISDLTPPPPALLSCVFSLLDLLFIFDLKKIKVRQPAMTNTVLKH